MTNPAPAYRNFTAAIYARVYEVRQMSDPAWLQERFDVMSRYIKVGKVYLETHRDMVVADEPTILQAKLFFESRGVRTSGGITVTVNEMNRFQTYCYTNPEHRAKLKEVVEFTAGLFDEVILDDFFFTNCKCSSCIQAKGRRSWTDFRLELMTRAARELIIEPARAVNPNVQLVIKYPNWYEHFQALGFNLETEPPIFDRLYTGTETRDPVHGGQHFQPYQSYLIYRFFDAVKPGANGGGWVDPFASHHLDRYAEQLWLTLFAKAPEITLFDFRSLQRPIQEADRAPWQGSGASFDFDALIGPLRLPDGSIPPDVTISAAAGRAFEQADAVLGRLGSPLGVKSYKPFHSHGEDFIHNYLGMLGIPIDLSPRFPAEAPVVFLAESAKFDPQIVEKIERQLQDGKAVVITAGLLRALQERGLRGIVELECSPRKAAVSEFLIGWNRIYKADAPILLSQIEYNTNDSWEEVSGLGGYTGYPLLHSARYASGVLYVLNVPDNFTDLYRLPPEVLDRIRETLAQDLFVRLEGPALVALFAYDNGAFIVESFRDEPAEVHLVTDAAVKGLRDAQSGELLGGEETLDWRGQPTGKRRFTARLAPHQFRLFELEPPAA